MHGIRLYVAQRKDGMYWTHSKTNWTRDISKAWVYFSADVARANIQGLKAVRVYLTTKR